MGITEQTDIGRQATRLAKTIAEKETVRVWSEQLNDAIRWGHGIIEAQLTTLLKQFCRKRIPR